MHPFFNGRYPLSSEIAKYRINRPRIKFDRPAQLAAFRKYLVDSLCGSSSINRAALGPSQKSCIPLIINTAANSHNFIDSVFPKPACQKPSLIRTERGYPLAANAVTPLTINTPNKTQLILLNFFPMRLKKAPFLAFKSLSRLAGTKTAAVNNIPPIQKIALKT